LENFSAHVAFVKDDLVNDADRSEMQAWIRQTFSPMMQQSGYTAKPNESPTQRQRRAVLFNLLGYIGDDPQVVQQARTMVQSYMRDPESVDPTMARTVLSVAARHGDAELYDQYKVHMKAAKSPEQYYRYFRSLSDFQQSKLVEETLASTLTSEVRGQDLYMLPTMMENPAARETTWDFMRKNYNALNDKTGGGLGGFGIFLGAAESFCSPEKAQEVQQFFQEHPIQGTERNQKEAIESINSCATLKQQQQAGLAAWLKQNVSTRVASEGAKGSDASVR
jgi:aminopeptidase N